MATGVKVLSNRHVTYFLGPESAIDDYENPSRADLLDLINVTGAVNTENSELNIQSSTQQDDRVWTDEAGSQSRGETQFGGTLQFGEPAVGDTSSIFRVAKDIVSTPGVVLAAATRVVTINSAGITTGDEINVMRVQANIPRRGKNDVSHFYEVNFLPKDDVVVNYIVPSASPTAVTLTPSAAIASAAVGDIGQIKATYEGRNVGIGATWTSSLPEVVAVTQHGAWVALATGGPALITAKTPGGLISTAKSITVA